MNLRSRYLALALVTIGLGLTLQWVRPGLSFVFADVLGDALWGMMIYWLLGVAHPSGRPLLRAVIALAICWAVEFSQLYHTPWLDAFRSTTPGHLLLGSGFDIRDLAAYAIGVLLGSRLEVTLLRRALA